MSGYRYQRNVFFCFNWSQAVSTDQSLIILIYFLAKEVLVLQVLKITRLYIISMYSWTIQTMAVSAYVAPQNLELKTFTRPCWGWKKLYMQKYCITKFNKKSGNL